MKLDVDDKNIVLVVADTLSAFHLPTYGYERDTAPFLTELAEDNIVLEKAYANAPWTAPSHASLFSGELPSEHSMTTGNIQFNSRSFVQDLKEKGYTTTGITANSLVSESQGFARGFDSYHEVFDFDTENPEDFQKAAKKALKNPDIQTIKKGLVQNSHIEDFQFSPNQRCYSEEEECFENQGDLETKLQIVLGSRD